MKAKTKRRIRPLTLVLLWVWAICIFTVVDLFLNVAEFDEIRPRASLYRGMRVAAHKMVGEPIDVDHAVFRTPRMAAAVKLAARLDEVRESDDTSLLRSNATQADDPRVRIAALEKLGDREMLRRAVDNATETPKVRRAAARLLGRFGGMLDLEQIVNSKLPLVVRQGAVLGMGELGSVEAVEELLGHLESEPYGSTAVSALASVSNPKAGPALRQAALDATVSTEARVAICRALSRMRQPESGRALAAVLADPSNPTELRVAAANSLGRLCDTTAIATVLAATRDEDPSLARQARLTHARLSHTR